MSDDTNNKAEIRSKVGERYTSEELMVRLKFFIGICLALTLIGIVFVVLYSIIFVTQPLNAMSPIDAKFFELIIPVATFLCGTLSGIMLAGSGKEAALAGAAAQQMVNNSLAPKPSAPTPIASVPVAPPVITPAPAPVQSFAAPVAAGPVVAGFGGKAAPPPAEEPAL
jgi:hypothetical protein